MMKIETPGTVYATWLNVTGQISLRAGLDTYASEHMSTEQIDLMEQGYRVRIGHALSGSGIVLAGDEFIGPASTVLTTEELAMIVKGIDFDDLVADYLPGDDEYRAGF